MCLGMIAMSIVVGVVLFSVAYDFQRCYLAVLDLMNTSTL